MGFEASVFLLPLPQPAASITAATMAPSTSAFKLILTVLFMVSSKRLWRLWRHLLCLHPASTYLRGESFVTLLHGPVRSFRENA